MRSQPVALRVTLMLGLSGQAWTLWPAERMSLPKEGATLMQLDFDHAKASEIFRRHGVALAYLFGSQASGATSPLSDIDIAVLFGRQVPSRDYFDHQITLIADFIGLLHRNDVDVAVLNQATPLLAQEAIGGEVLYCIDEAVRVEFEKQALRRFVDTAPLRRQLAEAFDERMDARRAAEGNQ